MSGLNPHRFIGHSATVLTRQVLAALIQLATVVVVARAFGPDGNGVYGLALLLPTLLATFLNLGIAPANIYHLGSGRVSLRQAWRTSFQVALMMSVLGLLAGSLLILFFHERFFPGVPPEVLFVALLAFPSLLIVAFISSVFQGRSLFGRLNFLVMVQPALTLCFIAVVLLFGASNIALVVAAYTGASVIALVAGWYLLRKESGPSLEGATEGNYLKRAVSYGYKAHLSNILTFLNYRIDLFIVNGFLGPAATGIYLIAVQLSERMWILSQAVSTVLLPKLSGMDDASHTKRRFTALVSRWMFVITLLASLGLAAVAYPLIGLVFGAEYSAAYWPLVLLLPGVVIGSALKILANDIAARGHPGLNMLTSMVVVVVNIGLNVYLIPRHGILGAAVATSVAYTVSFVFCLLIQARLAKSSAISTLLPNDDDLLLLKKSWNFVLRARDR